MNCAIESAISMNSDDNDNQIEFMLTKETIPELPEKRVAAFADSMKAVENAEKKLAKLARTRTKSEHLLTMSPECTICNLKFPCIRHLRQHLRMHKKSASKREEHKTDIGSLGTMTKLHILKDKTIEDFKYLLKPKEVEPKCNLLLECSYCNQILPSKALLRRHFQEHFQNLKCPRKKQTRVTLELKCPYCSMKLSSRNILARHLRGHFERSMCPLCDRRFKNRIDLQLHASREHGAIECSPQFSCHICGKQFHRNEHLTKHIRTHINDRPFECDLCRKTFGRKDKLKLHMNWHNGVKPHQCPHCDRSFSQKVHMTNHTRIHTGEKPFKCTLCDKAYGTMRSLKAHMNVHRVARQ